MYPVQEIFEHRYASSEIYALGVMLFEILTGRKSYESKSLVVLLLKPINELMLSIHLFLFFFSSRRRHTRLVSDWSSDVCSSDLTGIAPDARRTRVCLEPAHTRVRLASGAMPVATRVIGDGRGMAAGGTAVAMATERDRKSVV